MENRKMESAIEKCKNYVYKHKKYVKMSFDLLMPEIIKEFNLTDSQQKEIEQQIEVHDNSKFDEDELEPYANYFFGDRTDEAIKEFKKASTLHKSKNPHHPEYWLDREQEMPLNFVIEMVCDWWAFSLAQNSPTETLKWYEANKQKLNLPAKTTEQVEKMLEIIRQFAAKHAQPI